MSWLSKNEVKTIQERNKALELRKKKEEEEKKVPVHPYLLLYNSEKPTWETSQLDDDDDKKSLNTLENWEKIDIKPFTILAKKIKIVNDSNLPNTDILTNTTVV